MTPNSTRQLLDRIAFARIRLHDKLVNLDIKSLGLSDYNQRYLGAKAANLKGILQIYGRLLYLCLNNRPVSPENFVLVDYGGGSGVMSFLAAEIGIGTVIYNDIYDVSCVDVGRLANALGFRLDHVVCGDVDKLVSYLQKNSISINAIASYDVLEHIYDVESHFRKLASLAGQEYRVIYASGANIKNPIYVRSLKKQQIESEHKTRTLKWGHKERDTLQSFLDVRRNMISRYAPDFFVEQIEQLARSTRGLRQGDIEKCVDEFRLRGSISYRIDHSTNTCDPYTGNWCEHLMNFNWLEQIVHNAGFSAEIMTGFYNTSGTFIKRSIKWTLNAMIRVLGRRGMFLAPYYVVYAFPARKGAAHD